MGLAGETMCPTVLVLRQVSHPDHTIIGPDVRHRVEMNPQSQCTAMTHVACLR